MLKTKSNGRLRFLMNLYPPFWGVGIRLQSIAPDFRRAEVTLAMRWWNKNYVGTHYGGSIYSMTDPWYMLLLIHILGRGYVVWDKAATIRFKKPGKDRLRAVFVISDADLDSIRQTLLTATKAEPVFAVQVLDQSGEVIAEVDKTIYIRKKDPAS